MLNPIVSFFLYLFEFLISYIVFSNVSEKKRRTSLVLAVGLLIYEFGAIINIVFNNTIWINSIYTVFSTFLFATICFRLRARTAAVYAILMIIFSGAFEFATIFAISTLAGAEITAYNSDPSLLLIEISISKTFYLISCIALVRVPRNNVAIEKVPGSFYLFPLFVLFSLLCFWYISTHDSLSHTNQLLLSIISIVLLGSTVFLFITYRHNIEVSNENIRIKAENDRLQLEKAHYDILEHQNHQLMIYAHDTKNHLSAIRNLSSSSEIDKYIGELQMQLGDYARCCHSGNRILDVIINKYVTECELLGIAFEFDVRSCNLKLVLDIDLVSILGNLLDNALTAAEKSLKKTVVLETTTRNSYCVVIVTNSCDEEPNSSEMRLISTKKDKRLHGLGIESIKKTLAKYHGDYNWDYDADERVFIATVIMKSQE